MLLRVFVVFCFIFGSLTDDDDYDYESRGPIYWPSLFPKYCAGRKQSPVHLCKTLSSYDDAIPPYFYYYNTSMSTYELQFKNDGHKLKVDFEGSSPLRLGIKDKDNLFYTAAQLHWHWGSTDNRGSEHVLDRREFPMEGHLVYWNSRDYKSLGEAISSPNGLAVVGVFYYLSDIDNPLLWKFEDALKDSKLIDKGGYITVTVDSDDLDFISLHLPFVKEFYRYEGGLTTPVCTENVLWTVYSQPVPISHRQLGYFRALKYTDGSPMVNNYRQPQSINDVNIPGAKRIIYRNFKSASSVTPTYLCLLIGVICSLLINGIVFF